MQQDAGSRDPACWQVITPSQPARPIGFVVAMPVEARSLGASGPFDGITDLDGQALLAVCGIGPVNARVATEALLAAGAGGLVSWGCAGVLAARLQPGDCLLPATVVCSDAAYETHAVWQRRLQQRLNPVVGTHDQPIYSGGKLVSSLAERQQLAAETGAIAVDMESGAIAEAAAAAGVPFVVVRAIADPVQFDMPDIIPLSIDPDGFPSVPRLLRALTKRPAEIPALWRFAGFFRHAHSTLATVFRNSGSTLLGP